MTTPAFVAALREAALVLSTETVRRVEISEDGRVLLEADDFALILPPPGGSSMTTSAAPTLTIAAPPESPARAVTRRTPASPVAPAHTEREPAPPEGYAPHNGRHRVRGGICTRCGESFACPRCQGAITGSGDDKHCVNCGWAGATRAPTAAEDPDVLPEGVLRRREPRHGGSAI